MRREKLVSLLLKAGYVAAAGTKYDKFRRGTVTVMVPRHTEISDILAKKILKEAGITQ
ncbi:MAG: hypothetical protein J6Y80_07175 [Victivallales bacterium]|nr:hypothetical protein [Victivallales bacterium]